MIEATSFFMERGIMAADTSVFDWSLYRSQSELGTFSPSQKKSAYTRYATAVHSASASFPIRDYVFLSQVRDAVRLDFELLESIIADDILFQQLDQKVKDEIHRCRAEYARLLLNDAKLSGNRYDPDNDNEDLIKKYEKISSSVRVVGVPAAASSRKPQADAQNFWSGLDLELSIKWFGFFNIYRLLIAFFRLTWIFIVSAIRMLQRLPAMIDESLLIAVTPIFNVLSVGLFFGRLVVDFAMCVKHVVRPATAQEKDVNFIERFNMEWNKRYRRMVNDGFWSSANGLSNFYWIFGISVSLAGPLLVGFLTFDIAWFVYKWRQDELAMNEMEEILKGMSPSSQSGSVGNFEDESYEHDGESVNREIRPLIRDVVDHPTQSSVGSSVLSAAQIKVIELQLRALNVRRESLRANYLFSIAAAIVLVVSFACFVAFAASPLAGPLCFFGCALGVAMYLSVGDFSNLWKTRVERELAKITDESLLSRKEAEKQALIKFALGFVESLIVPALLIGLLTVNWPAALACSLAYLVIRNYNWKKSGDAEEANGAAPGAPGGSDNPFMRLSANDDRSALDWASKDRYEHNGNVVVVARAC